MRAIIYARKSTDRSDKQALSLSAQLDECRKLADREDLDVVEVIEEARSAKEPGRPEFGRMLARIHAGEADVIVCWKLDRLSRNPVDEGSIKWALQEARIKGIYTVTDGVFRPGDNVVMVGLHFGMSTQYVLELKKNTMRGMRKKLENGGTVSLAPYGYKNDRLKKTVEVDDMASETVRQIFKMRAGGRGFGEIAKTLEQQGVRNRSGKAFGASSIEAIIKNKFYLGVMRFSGDYFIGNHDRFIPKSLWEEANAVGRSFEGYKHREFLFKGLVRTTETNKLLTASLAKGKYVSYHTQPSDPKRVRISEDAIIEWFDKNIERYTIPKYLMGDFLQGLEDYHTEQFGNTREIRRKIEKGLQECADRKKRLLEHSVRGLIDEDEFLRERSEVSLREVNLKKDLDGLGCIDDALVQSAREIIELLGNLAQTWKTLSIIQKGVFVRTIIIELTVDEQKRLYVKENRAFEMLGLLNSHVWLPGLDSNQ